MSDMDPQAAPARTALSHSDLTLIEALQRDPRAPWAQLASALGVSPPTARRRWERLVEDGAAWLTSYPGMSGLVAGLVEVRCRPGTSDDVAAALVQHPRIVTVSAQTGDRDLGLIVFAEHLAELRRIVQRDLGSHADVLHVRSSVMTRVFREGSHWRAGVLAERTRAPVEPPAATAPPLGAAAAQAVLAELELDGRAPTARIAAALGTGEAHARRTLHRLLESRRIVQRVDVTLEQSRWPHSLALWMVVPAGQLDDVARRIGELPTTRLCAALAGGASNLYAIVWLRSLDQAAEIEAQITRGLPARVLDRSLLLHYYKRLGHLFDDERRRTGQVPWVLGREMHAEG